jgi:hypothetical protein
VAGYGAVCSLCCSRSVSFLDKAGAIDPAADPLADMSKDAVVGVEAEELCRAGVPGPDAAGVRGAEGGTTCLRKGIPTMLSAGEAHCCAY